MIRALLLSVVLVALTPLVASAAVVRGTVYIDIDGDGAYSAGDQGVAGVLVGFEDEVYATTDDQGGYELNVNSPGIVWVRTPDGFEPAPSWGPVTGAADATLDLKLTPSKATGQLRFIIGADVHLGATTLSDATAAFDQAAALVPEPYFMTIVGDLSDMENDDNDFKNYLLAAREIPFPVVTVPGNHDWYDGGVLYRKFVGPPQYSFDCGGVHFVVLNFMDMTSAMAFAAHDMARVPPGTPAVALIHWLNDGAYADQLVADGFSYVFTGHAHSNKSLLRTTGLVEVNTEATIFGGIDFTPSGYRVVARVGDGFAYEHHTTVLRPVAELMSPRDGTCVASGRSFEIIAAVESGATLAQVTASIDGAAPVTLSHVSGWDFVAESEAIAAGNHTIDLEISDPTGTNSVRKHTAFCVATDDSSTDPFPDWPQLQGGADRRGSAPGRLAPPLKEVWTKSAGGNLLGGSPVVAGDKLIVPVSDLDYMTVGGIIAFDARTGVMDWEDRIGQSVRNAPAVANDIVVFMGQDAIIHADDLATGARLWDVDVTNGGPKIDVWHYSAPAIVGDRVVMMLEGTVYAFDLATGAADWSVAGVGFHPYATLASPSSTDATGVAAVGNNEVIAWDATTGDERWLLMDETATRIHTAPVIADGMVFLGNGDGKFFAVDLETGDPVWSRQIYPQAGLGYGVIATPAYSDGRLFVGSPVGPLLALSADSGAELWRAESGTGVVRPFMYRTDSIGFYGSVAVTGNVVWAAGVDGKLRALDATTGDLLDTTDFGVPVMSGVVPAGDSLFVATYDGTVHALRAVGTTIGPDAGPDAHVEPTPDGGCACSIDSGPVASVDAPVGSDARGPSPRGGGCACAGRGASGVGTTALFAALLIGVTLRRRRRVISSS